MEYSLARNIVAADENERLCNDLEMNCGWKLNEFKKALKNKIIKKYE